MGLVQVATTTVTSAVASVTLTGIDSDDVYMVAYNNVTAGTDRSTLEIRVTVSGSPDTTSNYDSASEFLRANTSFGTVSATNEDRSSITVQTGTTTNEQVNGLTYCFNFNNASEYSFLTIEGTMLDYNSQNTGLQGGVVNTVAQSCDGLQFFFIDNGGSSANITAGTFTLYKVV
jgi:hypothetical protein